ncbi:MAG: alpha/beta hydrolase [Actinomycetota bacterium]|nr:alpha/beta hydrolase [Actinomycetota bacterium]
MTGLREPPTKQRPSRVVARFLVLVILLAVVGGVVWVAVTNQRIGLIEDVVLEDLELEDVAEVEGLRINVTEGTGGLIPVILLHDRDVVGSAMLDGVAAELSGRFRPVQIDLPGYGFSSRIPEVATAHTIAAMAETILSIIEERYTLRPVLVGVGLGGKVAAEIAVTDPDLIRGLVMVDVDFWEEQTWELFAQGLPFVGEAATYTFETGGRLAFDKWAPHCAEGGWCPSASQSAVRSQVTEIRDTTASLNAFLATPVSSLVPSDLDKITAPVAYLWSSEGVVPEANADRVFEAVPGIIRSAVPVWKAHLTQPVSVVDLIDEVGR